MPERPANHVRLPRCPQLRHLAHPGYTCAEEDTLRIRIATYLDTRVLTMLPATALAGTTFGPGPRTAAA